MVVVAVVVVVGLTVVVVTAVASDLVYEVGASVGDVEAWCSWRRRCGQVAGGAQAGYTEPALELPAARLVDSHVGRRAAAASADPQHVQQLTGDHSHAAHHRLTMQRRLQRPRQPCTSRQASTTTRCTMETYHYDHRTTSQ